MATQDRHWYAEGPDPLGNFGDPEEEGGPEVVGFIDADDLEAILASHMMSPHDAREVLEGSDDDAGEDTLDECPNCGACLHCGRPPARPAPPWGPFGGWPPAPYAPYPWFPA